MARRKLDTQQNLQELQTAGAEELLSAVGAFSPVKTALDVTGMNPLSPRALNSEADFRKQFGNAIPTYRGRPAGDAIYASPYAEAVAADPRLRALTPYLMAEEIQQLPEGRRKVPNLEEIADYATGAGQRQYVSPRHDVNLDPEHMANLALAGAAKVGWYEASHAALVEVFGKDDAARFAGLLAATSPQTSVEANFLNTLNIWKNWTAAGRPTDRDEILKIMGQSVQGGRGEKSVLPGWKNNSVTALQEKDPFDIQLSGPKVQSFMKNLQGFYDYSTNDTWQGRAFNVLQDVFSGVDRKDGDGLPGQGYLATNAAMRRATELLRERTGYDWTVANVQEAIWSYTKTLLDYKNSRQQNPDAMNAAQLVDEQAITGELIANTPDFASLFQQRKFAQPLIDAGILAPTADGGAGLPAAGGVTPLTVRSFGQQMPIAPDQRMLEQFAIVIDDVDRAKLDTNAVNFQYEMMPYANSQHLPELFEDEALAQEYLDDPRADFMAPGETRDALVQALNKDRVRPTRDGIGVWAPEGGEVEFNKLMNPSLVGPDDKNEKLPSKLAKRQDYDVLSATRAAMGAQGGVSWNYPTPQRAAEFETDAASIFYPTALMPQQMEMLARRYPNIVLSDTGSSITAYPYSRGDKDGLADVEKLMADEAFLQSQLGTGTRVRPMIVNQDDAFKQWKEKKVGTGKKATYPNKRKQAATFNKKIQPKQAGFMSFEQEFKTPGQGLVTRKLLKSVDTATPGFRENLQGPKVRRAIKDIYELDKEMEARGLKVRPDIQLMRQRFMEGGFDELQRALDRGEPLANLSALERFRAAS